MEIKTIITANATMDIKSFKEKDDIIMQKSKQQ